MASLLVHGGLGGLVFVIPERVVETTLPPIELTQKKEPPKPEPPKPKAQPPKPPEVPKDVPKVVRRKPRKRVVRPPSTPPPTEQPPQAQPDTEPQTGPKIFGLDYKGTTTAAPGTGVVVPKGDTVGVSPRVRKRGKKQKPRPTGFKKTYQAGEAAPVAVITTHPRVTKRVEPPYPDKVKDLGIEGRVVLQLTIDHRGRVIKVKLLRGLRKELDQGSMAAARKMRFAPATVNGTPVKVTIPYTFTFVLD